jgi:diguanylate cyclase (GGDEF)-like protein/PAS domain S-box-containing protein
VLARGPARSLAAAALIPAYAALYLALYPVVGHEVDDLAIIPAAGAGGLLGLPGGVLAAVVLPPLTTLLLNASGQTGWDAIVRVGHGPLIVLIALVGVGVGVLRDLTLRARAQAGAIAEAARLLRDENEQRTRAEARLRESNTLYETLLRAQSDLGEALVIGDRDRPTFWNAELLRLTGYPHEEIATLPSLYELIAPEERDRFRASVRDRLRDRQRARLETVLRRKDGRPVDVEVSLTPLNDDRGGVVILGRDVSDRKSAQRALEHQALHDALTGLANRTLLRDRLEHQMVKARRGGERFALLLMDLDRFKAVNDGLGHAAGDVLLREIAERMRQAVRASDTVARVGGDEFAMLLPDTDSVGAARVGRDLRDVVQRPVPLEGVAVDVGASIGYVIFAEDGADASTLLRRADMAMYAAKGSGGGLTRFAAEMEVDGKLPAQPLSHASSPASAGG